MRALIRLILPCLLLVALGAGKGGSVPALVAEAARTGATDRAAAIVQLERYLAARTDPSVEPWAMVWAGEQRRLAGEGSRARAWFERAAERYPTHTAKNGALLGMALVDAERSLSGNVLATLQLLSEEGAPDTANADRYRLLARVAADEGTTGSKVREYARKAQKFAEGDPAVAARVQRTLADILKPEEGEPGGGAVPSGGDDAAAIALARLRGALERRRFDEAIAQGRRFAEAWPDHPLAAKAASLTRRAEAGDPTTARRVGVLLPLSGEYAPPGANLKQAIELANQHAGGPLDLRFVDTAGDPNKAVAAVESLVLEQGVVLLLGPLLKAEVEKVAIAAENFEVPLITLSQSADATAIGPHVHNGSLTVEHQVQALIEEVMGGWGVQRFAILYPENAYGQNARDLFAAGVTARGGTVAAVEGYDPEATDFRPAARKLGGKDVKARANELYRLRMQARARGDDPDKVTLPPTIAFEAIFLPDNVRRSALVASALAFEEFAVGAFRPHRNDQPILLLGLNGWNSSDLVRAGGQYLRGCLFVDAWWSGDPRVERFAADFQAAAGRAPMVLDAMAWDVTRLVVEALTEAGADRAVARKLLSEVRITNPVAGGDHFGPAREVERKLHILTVDSSGITPAELPQPPIPEQLEAPL